MHLQSATSTGVIAFQELSKTYGGKAILDRVSFEVPRGELFALVGGNGAGKTTLIRCLLDFCAPDSGSIELFGMAHDRTAARKDLAYLPERFTPSHYLTGRDFLRYMAALHGNPYDEGSVRRTFEALDLDPSALLRPARTYSKGMTQKLGLAACLLSGKALHVLDEPASGLDPKARALLKRALRGLRSSAQTVLFTSHALADVGELCDRMGILHAGQLRFVGTPAELTARYGGSDLEKAFLACVDETVPA